MKKRLYLLFVILSTIFLFGCSNKEEKKSKENEEKVASMDCMVSEEGNYQTLKFRFYDKDDNTLQMSCTLDVVIENYVGDVVYEKTHQIKISDYEENTLGDFMRWDVAYINIPTSDITIGCTSLGTVKLTVTGKETGVVKFKNYETTIRTLPYTSHIDIASSSPSTELEEEAIYEVKQTASIGLFYSKEKMYNHLIMLEYPDTVAYFAVCNSGVDWYEQALLKGQDYLNEASYTKKELKELLKKDKFEISEINYALDNLKF